MERKVVGLLSVILKELLETSKYIFIYCIYVEANPTAELYKAEV